MAKIFTNIRKMVDVKQGLKNVLDRIEAATQRRPSELQAVKPRLVAVTKTKPNDLIIQAYEAEQRHFGENYVQELVDKANSADILDRCSDIRWHFIGHLQSNKINAVLSIPNLHTVETVDSKKLADNLNKKWPNFRPQQDEGEGAKLNIMLQVNTSGEEAKSGINPKEIVELARHVIENCPNLKLEGLMTIGEFDYDYKVRGPNRDFLKLIECRESVCKELNLDWKDVNLSMGMSDDFEHAIELGSTNVRVGSSIFGYREKKN